VTVVALGIETSCDETAAAVVRSDGTVLSDVVKSQADLHVPFGGVVPEVAARDHAHCLPRVVERALADAGMTLADVDGVAVTARPGLAGALVVGLQLAKGLAWGSGKPFVTVDHLVGHLLAVFLRRGGVDPGGDAPAFPFVALLASGGHTAVYRVDGPLLDRIRELGATRDDAAGEAFDKAAKLLGLGYPGGPAVDALAARGVAARSAFKPPPAARRLGFEFSFSGLKSALARHVELHGRPTGDALADACAAFQDAVVTVLVDKTLRAARTEGLERVVLGGGVAANRGLRVRFAERAASAGVVVHVPPMASCTDNAAMIAYAGALRLDRGERDGLDASPSTKSALLGVTRKGGGRRCAS
jgi:N6-L-threonylcarbamoyladenine synthase